MADSDKNSEALNLGDLNIESIPFTCMDKSELFANVMIEWDMIY